MHCFLVIRFVSSTVCNQPGFYNLAARRKPFLCRKAWLAPPPAELLPAKRPCRQLPQVPGTGQVGSAWQLPDTKPLPLEGRLYPTAPPSHLIGYQLYHTATCQSCWSPSVHPQPRERAVGRNAEGQAVCWGWVGLLSQRRG